MQKRFWTIVLVIVVLKILLSAIIPFTGDEAYFYIWGENPDYGYYDHPPMVGWILHLLLYLGRSEAVLRLPAVLFPVAVGILIYLLLKDRHGDKAFWASTLFMVSPLNILNVIVTTDTPLFFFAFLAGAFFYLGVKKNEALFYALSGLGLGLAILSKYFAFLIGLSFLIYAIMKYNREKTILKGTFITLIVASLPALINLFWNYNHCWANIVFNLMTRHTQKGFSVANPIGFILTQIYLMTPFILYYLIKEKRNLKRIKKDELSQVSSALFLIPLGLFFLLSIFKSIGGHWAISFYPFFFLSLFFIFDSNILKRLTRIMAGFTLIHVLIILATLAVPTSLFKDKKFYSDLVFYTQTKKFSPIFELYEDDHYFATKSYSASAMLTYYTGKYFSVFGKGSKHGRQDDIITDFKSLDKENFLIFSRKPIRTSDYENYFSEIEVQKLQINNADFYLLKGFYFNFNNYKKTVLEPVKDKYYRLPKILPLGNCYFDDKYFNEGML